MTALDNSISLMSYPANSTLQNATGLMLSPYISDGIWYNGHILVIEQLIGGILLIMTCILIINIMIWWRQRVPK